MKLLVLLFLLFSTFLALEPSLQNPILETHFDNHDQFGGPDKRWKNGIKLKWASGCTISGITAQTFKVKGEDCGRMCELDYFCTHFTWRKTGGNTELGNCDLMQGAKDLEHIVVDDWSQVCGVMNKTDGGWIPAQDDVMWAKGCELGYTEVLDTKEDIYAYACAPICIEHPRCTHFMWKSITDDRDTGKCMLLEGYNKEQPKKADKEDVCGFIKTD